MVLKYFFEYSVFRHGNDLTQKIYAQLTNEVERVCGSITKELFLDKMEWESWKVCYDDIEESYITKEE